MLLTFTDQVVYTACVGRIAGAIDAALKWTKPQCDYAYQIRDPSIRDWLRLAYACWNDYRKASLSRLDAGALIMVSTDITGFYEHISHELLASDLRALDAPEEIVALLSKALGRWATINGRGLPQSHVASHLLAKLYLNVVDRGLREAGFSHVRYVDDMRLFCADRAEMKRAILQLSTALRRRGLSLQSSKTDLFLARAARDHVEGVIPTLMPLAKHYLEEIADKLGVNPAYLTVTEAEEALTKEGIEPPTELLQHAYRVHFTNAAKFEKTLFHYLLSRLGAAKDPFAADHVLTLLEPHPDETDWILEYYSKVRPVSSAETILVQYLTSSEAIYPYQHYLVIRWRAQFLEPPGDEFLAYIRRVHSAPQSPAYLKSAARHLLGHAGSPADLENLAGSYGAAASESEKAECIIALYRLEKTRRNALFGQAKNDGLLVSAAVDLVKGAKLPKVLGAV